MEAGGAFGGSVRMTLLTNGMLASSTGPGVVGAAVPPATAARSEGNAAAMLEIALIQRQKHTVSDCSGLFRKATEALLRVI